MLLPTEENTLFRGALKEGNEEDRQKRATAELIATTLASLSTQPDSGLTSTSTGEPIIPEPRRWDEGTPLQWEGGHYRVVSELGTGATGRTYKLEQIDPNSDASLGTFVGKVVTNPEVGQVALNAFRRSDRSLITQAYPVYFIALLSGQRINFSLFLNGERENPFQPGLETCFPSWRKK